MGALLQFPVKTRAARDSQRRRERHATYEQEAQELFDETLRILFDQQVPPPPKKGGPMKIAVLCLLLLPGLALAQENPYSCADVKFNEPGWACVEHFAYDFPAWGNTVGFLANADLDAKGNLYRATRREAQPTAFCGGTVLRGYALERLAAGYGPDRPDLLTRVLEIPDRCASSALAAQVFAGGLKVLEDERGIVLVSYPTAAGHQAGWAIRIYRVQ